MKEEKSRPLVIRVLADLIFKAPCCKVLCMKKELLRIQNLVRERFLNYSHKQDIPACVK